MYLGLLLEGDIDKGWTGIPKQELHKLLKPLIEF